MRARDAVREVHAFIGDEHPYSSIHLRDGFVWGMTPEQGCRVACEEIGHVNCAVDGVKLLRVLNSVRGHDDISFTLTKGRRLQIKARDSKFSIKALPESAEAELPDVDLSSAAFVDVSPSGEHAIHDIVRIAADSGPLMGVRLTETHIVAADQTALVVLWCPALPRGVPPVTVPESIFKGLKGRGFALAVQSGLVWVDCGESIRWTRTYNDNYPDETVLEMVAAARNDPGRVVYALDLDHLRDLAAQAESVVPDKVEGFLMSCRADKITLDGGDQTSKWGDAHFLGEVPALALRSCWHADQGRNGTGPDVHVGVVPADLKKMVGMVASFSPKGKQALAVSPSRGPVVIWGSLGSVTMEVLVRQVYVDLPGE